MKKREKPLQYVRVQNPFDDGAAERLRRIGLRSSDGRANDDAILTLSCVYAGLLFDDLCDYYQDYACVSRDLQQLFVAAETAPARQRFLMLCLQYDGLSQPLPNPIWWISGDSELASSPSLNPLSQEVSTMKKMILCVLLSMTLSITSFAMDVPTDTVVQNLDGSQQAIKTFTIAPDRDPQQLIEEPFELGGFLYSFADIKKTENRIHENKMHTEVITVETAKDDLGVILEQLAPTLQYDDGTFRGTLSLDHTSIQTEVSGYTTKSSKTMDIQTIGQLDRNDMSYVPATTVKNGKTLSLENVEWQVTGTELVGDILVPCSYQAIATYSAKSSYKVATGYITTAEYVGTVSHEGVENVTYTLTYLGEEVLQEEADDGLWEKVKTFASDNWQYILCVLSLSAAMICMVLQIRLRKAIKGARSIEQENEAGEDDEDEEDLV